MWEKNKVICEVHVAFQRDNKEKVCYTIGMDYIHDKNRFTTQLLTWYDKNKRSLPWREQPIPYYVWVSEIMLQQTRVEAVKPYFQRFITQLPTLSDLAECDDDALVKLWEGLGYYNRVRNMKKCAIVCVEQYGGNLPSSYDELLSLPGIGSYTAGAIASIAFKKKVPAVDGNVLRVFSRVLISEDDILAERTKKKFQMILMEYIPPRCDAFNQALMELGAMICVPNAAPRCNICPVASECMGYQSGDMMRLPNKKSKKKRRIEEKTVLLFLYKGKVYLKQRAQQGLLAGLYEFEMIEGYKSKKEISVLTSYFGQAERIQMLSKSKHIFSHIEWHMKGYLITLSTTCKEGVWATYDELLNRYAIATALKQYRFICEQYMKENTEL